MKETPEFNKYAQGYSGGNEDPLKRFFGKDLDRFIYVKAKWLWNFLNLENAAQNGEVRLLDYGCGTGEMLRWLMSFGFQGQMHGADVSSEMINEAQIRWNASSKPTYSCVSEVGTDFDNDYFDYIVLTCVFHHIEPGTRDKVLHEINRILVPGGKLIVFEHNPLNPLTRLIVKRAVIDKNAILLHPREIRIRFDRVLLRFCSLNYLMFFPPNMGMFLKLEQYLGWCPMGAQYAIVGEKCSDMLKVL